MERERIDVAREHENVAVGTIPGSIPYTAVYVPVNERVYKINVYADAPEVRGLDARSKELLSDVRLEPPSRSVGSLDLPDANSPETLFSTADPRLVEDEEAEHRTATGEDETARISAATRGGGEKEIAEGCFQADPRFWVQTQHGKHANEDRWKGRRPGWTRIGLYNYWGEYTHGNLGYGRCPTTATRTTSSPSTISWGGETLSSPPSRVAPSGSPGGKKTPTKNYGISVVIETEHSNERYVSMPAHPSGLQDWVRKGASVNEDKIIGFAGNTGDPSIPAGDPYLHQAFYRNPDYIDGGPYGGEGLQVVRHHFMGTAARDANGGVYTFGRKRKSDNTCRASIVCGKGYSKSNRVGDLYDDTSAIIGPRKCATRSRKTSWKSCSASSPCGAP